ncbi:MAG: hypothetical protein EOQ98_21860 [Mesorhizobium sp.]|uniref:hypothetical protein n=1 Tax=Mesorhizobium sp. TaxID=1871066 RepID=UPI000FE5CCE3|nr:hypothetical protein [Mesorhizobium sp.]RWO96668.1 MAG: hypothetical protein EOQ98_21860 [Mesorhizobium sp.]
MTKRSDEIAAALQEAGRVHAIKSPSATRQRAFKKRMSDDGFVQVTGWVRSHQAADIAALMKRLKEDTDLEPGPMRNTRTGRLERV